METKQISSAEESIRIIEKMIRKAKNTVADNSFLFLLWGWLAFIAGIAQFALKIFLHYPHHYYSWGILLLALFISIVRHNRKKATSGSKTSIEYSIENLWTVIIASYLLFTAIFFKIGWEHGYTFYIFLMSMGCFLTGRLLDFFPLVLGSLVGGCLVLFSTFVSYDLDILVCSGSVLIGYIIPGHLLRAKYKKRQIRKSPDWTA